MIKIHAIQTGKVKVKQFQVTGASNQFSRLRQLLFTKRWSEWLPVYCWLVEHPDGPFLIDTGEIARVHESGYLPNSVLFKASVIYDVKREDEVDRQLAKLGYKPEQIKAVYLTHLHSDHVDGVYHFPKARSFAAKSAYDLAMSEKGGGAGYLKKNLPAWFKPDVFDFSDGPFDGFPSSHKLLPDGSLVAIPLPGHSTGHTGYILNTGSARYVFSADATGDGETLKNGIPFVILDNDEAHQSLSHLREYSQQPDVTVLCAHDWNVPRLLNS